MSKHVCIHGHFYQPPRENPWTDAVERQESAKPYHDWNERITAECYAPNAAARILDGDGRIVRYYDNYSRISLDFGPTLLRWMERRAPATHRAIVDADRKSRERFSGHGSALAQAYNHSILPLDRDRDRTTQVRWGVRDFEHRFGRRPEGMWLPETAVDLASLEALAAEGIRFTILEPHQARDASGAGIDPTRPYLQRLPSGRSIALFFYDGPLSRAVAFERLLDSGEKFAAALLHPLETPGKGARLVHVATDGETYGHHHRFGEMALAWVLDHLETRRDVRLTNYGEFLERHPPRDPVEISEATSWSCAHGVERWRADCGCGSQIHPGWNQAWRTPLREALDWLAGELAERFERCAARRLRDPWAARDDYIDVLLDPSDDSWRRFLSKHARRRLAAEEDASVRKLLECQRHAMQMFTSCGWFFDDLARIEPLQVLQYAACATRLAREVTGDDLEPELLERLERARSNRAERGTGRSLYLEVARAGRYS